jgi:hypothetical protein
MFRQIGLWPALVLGLVLVGGCGDKTKTETGSDDNGDKGVTPAAHHLCKECGQVEGAVACCAADAEKCEECKLTKDSPGCCNKDLLAGKTVSLCTACGEIAAAAHECNITEKCEKCSRQKGSPLCCLEEKKKES